jgi:hypothetical protein
MRHLRYPIEQEVAGMSEPKEHVNGRIPTALMERLRNAVWWFGRGLTVQELLEDALEKICTDLEKKHNGGKPFPQRQGELARSKRKNKPPGSDSKKK